METKNINSLVPALEYFGKDFTFPNIIDGLPTKLSDVKGLEIGQFKTNDGVLLNYWKAGQGEPLIFIPGWASSGAEYINLIYLLKEKFEVYVLDQRNHGLSQKVNVDTKIPRFSADLNDFFNSLNIKKAHLCGWSMGCSVIWSYIDLYGEDRINKFIFIDQPPSIYCHSNWTEEERLNAGAFTRSAETQIEIFASKTTTNNLVGNVNFLKFYNTTDAPAFENSLALSKAVNKKDTKALIRVMFNHIMNDWRDVISNKISKPTLIVTGEHSSWLESQHWIVGVVPNSKLLTYGKHEHGDHFLHLKKPQKFAQDLIEFLDN